MFQISSRKPFYRSPSEKRRQGEYQQMHRQPWRTAISHGQPWSPWTDGFSQGEAAEAYRQGPGRDGGIQLDDEQAEVDGEGSIDGKLDPGSHASILLDGQALLVAGAQELVDELVLARVELLEMLLVPLWVVDLHLPLGDVLAPVAAKVQRISRVVVIGRHAGRLAAAVAAVHILGAAPGHRLDLLSARHLVGTRAQRWCCYWSSPAVSLIRIRGSLFSRGDHPDQSRKVETDRQSKWGGLGQENQTLIRNSSGV